MLVKQANFTHAPKAAVLAPLAAIAPQLVLVFGSVDALTAPGLPDLLTTTFGNASLAGCTTAGEISGRGVSDGQLVITALHFDEPGFDVATTLLDGMGDSAAAGLRLARQLDQPGLHDVLVLGQGVDINGSALIEGFRKGLPPQVNLSGGLAGDGGAFKQTFTLSQHTVSSNQIVAIGFHAPGLVFRYGSFHGWQPFGPARKVTRCEGNILYELDGTLALDVYKHYLGDYAKDLPGSGLLFPFEMLGEDRQGLGLIRTILGVDDARGSLVLAGDIDPLGYLRLMHASTESLVEGAREAALLVGAQADGLGENGLALLVSCVGRKLVMGDRVDDEVDAVSEVFGRDTQIAGFYSNGEISPSQQGVSYCNLHNQTMTITHLAERSAKRLAT